METTPSSVSSQEKLAAALSCFVFFIPLLMNVKTPFVVKYMKQGFMVNVAGVVLSIITSFLWMHSGLIGLVNLALFITSVILALQAFAGKDYVIAFISENAEKLIQTLGISNIFTPGK